MWITLLWVIFYDNLFLNVQYYLFICLTTVFFLTWSWSLNWFAKSLYVNIINTPKEKFTLKNKLTSMFIDLLNTLAKGSPKLLSFYLLSKCLIYCIFFHDVAWLLEGQIRQVQNILTAKKQVFFLKLIQIRPTKIL